MFPEEVVLINTKRTIPCIADMQLKVILEGIKLDLEGIPEGSVQLQYSLYHNYHLESSGLILFGA